MSKPMYILRALFLALLGCIVLIETQPIVALKARPPIRISAKLIQKSSGWTARVSFNAAVALQKHSVSIVTAEGMVLAKKEAGELKAYQNAVFDISFETSNNTEFVVIKIIGTIDQASGKIWNQSIRKYFPKETVEKKDGAPSDRTLDAGRRVFIGSDGFVDEADSND